MEWIGVVAFIGVIYGAVVLWEKLIGDAGIEKQ